jgi:hypothetical protein
LVSRSSWMTGQQETNQLLFMHFDNKLWENVVYLGQPFL